MGDVVVEDMNPKALAKSIREFADDVERGDFVVVAFAMCDKEGNGGDACCVKQEFATPELLDEMLHSMKVKLFASLEDES